MNDKLILEEKRVTMAEGERERGAHRCSSEREERERAAKLLRERKSRKITIARA